MLALRPLRLYINQQRLRLLKSVLKIDRFRFRVHEISACLSEHLPLSFQLALQLVPLPLHKSDLTAESLNFFFLLYLYIL